MATKKTTIKDGSKVTVALVGDEDYLKDSGANGNPLLKANAGDRLYSNDRINGTTTVLLGILSELNTPSKKVYTLSELRSARDSVKASNFLSPSWKRIESEYKRYGGTSKSPVFKLSPVVSSLISKGAYLSGIDLSRVSSPEVRKVFGFSF